MHTTDFLDKPLSIGEVAELTSLTPRAIRYYHEIGLVPEPDRNGTSNRAYRMGEITRLLWVQRMTAAGLSLEAVREAANASDDQQVQTLLTELDRVLAAKEEGLRQQRAVIARLREFGTTTGLFTPEVAAAHKAAGLEVPSKDKQELMLLLEATLGTGFALDIVRAEAFLESRPGLKAEDLRLNTLFEELADVHVDDVRVERYAQEMAAHRAAVEAAEEAAGVRPPEPDFSEADKRGITLGAQAMRTATVQPSPAQTRAMERYVELMMADYFEEKGHTGAE
ncbi:MerR family transcriptional regulator [Streptomyces cavernae]|uniref:helix-turn-helix domain-containing protein n=1 Tax=Streptomyces cavernae TaxID=2259034 RepID=UPI000FEBADC0|nr:MerR family transcriptional regulator [Streptomyces cavernae]